jgi:nucleoside-diphosphate-sugar epimerase
MCAVHVDDAAAATVAALDGGRAGQAYNIADSHPLTWTDYLEAVAAAAGAPPPYKLPNSVFRFSYLGGIMTRASIRLDTGKARRELGWTPTHPSFREGIADVAAAWREATR